MRPLAFAVAIAALAAAPAWAQKSWEEQLTRQLLEDQNCEVTFITQVIERDLPDGKLIQALVGCADQRNFIAYRDKDLQRFKLTICKKDERAC